jgi:hypothetical protein
MARVKKPKIDPVAGGVEALATLAADQRSKAGRAVGSYTLPKQPSHLASEDMLIAVVHGNSVAVRTVRKPARLGPGGARLREPFAEYLAQRFAEIDTAVGEMLDSSVVSRRSADANVLTADQESVLSSGDFDTSRLRVEEEAPLTQTALEFAGLLQASLSVEQAAGLLRVNASRIRQRLGGEHRSLYGIKQGKTWRVPKFQFVGRHLVPGMGQVLAALPRDLHPVAIQRWFTTPHSDLRSDADADEERTVAPIDWLKAGHSPDTIVDLAREL